MRFVVSTIAHRWPMITSTMNEMLSIDMLSPHILCKLYRACICAPLDWRLFRLIWCECSILAEWIMWVINTFPVFVQSEIPFSSHICVVPNILMFPLHRIYRGNEFVSKTCRKLTAPEYCFVVLRFLWHSKLKQQNILTLRYVRHMATIHHLQCFRSILTTAIPIHTLLQQNTHSFAGIYSFKI